jgi:hypothetical protein
VSHASGSIDTLAVADRLAVVASAMWPIVAGFVLTPFSSGQDAARILSRLRRNAHSDHSESSGPLRSLRRHSSKARGSDVRSDRVAAAATAAGSAFIVVALIDGPLWSRLTFGKWWTWEPVLVAGGFALVGNAGYLAVRALGGHRRQRARRAAIPTLPSTGTCHS